MATQTEIIGEIKVQLNTIDERGQDTKEKVDELYKVVVVGNGHPSLRASVARHDDWINSANKLIWIFVTALVGQALVTVCAFLVWVVTFVFQSGIVP